MVAIAAAAVVFDVVGGGDLVGLELQGSAVVVGVVERAVVADAIGPVEGEESWKRGHPVVVVVADDGFEYSRVPCCGRVVLEAWL